MTKQTAAALILTAFIWMGALAASAIVGATQAGHAMTARAPAIHPVVAPAEVNPCASGACW